MTLCYHLASTHSHAYLPSAPTPQEDIILSGTWRQEPRPSERSGGCSRTGRRRSEGSRCRLLLTALPGAAGGPGHKPRGADCSLVPDLGPGGPAGPALPLWVLGHEEIWGSQVRSQGNRGSGMPFGAFGTALLPTGMDSFDVLATRTSVLAENEPVGLIRAR